MSSGSDCKKVVTLPQSSPICWFTALMMAVFYSQHMRDLLVHEKMHKWSDVAGENMMAKRKRKLYEIFHEMLASKYTYNVKSDDFKYFESVSPERILRLLNLADRKTFSFDPTMKAGYNSILYIQPLLTLLGVSSMVLNAEYDDSDYVYNVFAPDPASSAATNATDDVDVVIMSVSPSKSNRTPDFEWQPDDPRPIKIGSMEYILDSNTLTNYTRAQDVCTIGHQIAGITCNGERFVYNGWMRKTTGDPAAAAADATNNTYPCELMPFDWLNNREDFCLNPSMCGLEASTSSSRLCFNFYKGQRMFIFVRKSPWRASVTPPPTLVEYKADDAQLKCLRKTSNWSKLLPEHKFDKGKFNPEAVLRDLPTVSPKTGALLSKIKELDKRGKHFVFSEIKFGYGAKAIVSALLAEGYHMAYDKNLRLKSPKELLATRGKNIALLCSTDIYGKPVTAKFKKDVLSLYNNRPDNVHGNLIRIIVLDGGYKEGVDLFDVQHVHVLEPQTSAADDKQVVGRATRTCGQKGLSFVPNVGWPLHVHVYDAQLPPDLREFSLMAQTLFELWFDNSGLDLRKLRLAGELEKTCMEIAIDAELTQTVHAGAAIAMKGGNVPTVCKKRKTRKTDIPTHILLAAWLSLEDASARLDAFRKSDDDATTLYHAVCKLAQSDRDIQKRLKEALDNPIGFIDTHGAHIGKLLRRSKLLGSAYYKRAIQKWLSSSATPAPPSPTKVISRLPERFKKYAWPPVVIENQCIDAAPPKDVPKAAALQFTPTQEFVRHFFTPSNRKVKGMLLYHSVGTGKTCTAIATATSSFEQEDYTILWATRTTLKSDLWKNMFDQVCHMGLRDGSAATIPKEMDARKRLLSTAWSVPPMSYKQFSNLVDQKNQFYHKLVSINGKKDPLRKTLLIIDEAHKLVATGGDLSAQERPNLEALRAAIHHSYEVSGDDSVRVLLMTATPFTNDPMELVKLINLLKPSANALPDDFDAFAERFLTPEGKFSEDGRAEFEKAVGNSISYLNRSFDPRQFAQPIFHPVHVPISRAKLIGITTKKHLQAKKAMDKEALQDRKKGVDASVKSARSSLRSSTSDYASKSKECMQLQKAERAACRARVKAEKAGAQEALRATISENIIEKNRVRNELKAVQAMYKDYARALKTDMSQEHMLAEKCGFV